MASTGNANRSSSTLTREIPKNVIGNKSDPTWQYIVSLNARSRRVKCKFCELSFARSAYRVKH